MKIGIDLDGTIADNLELLIKTLNVHCGKDLLCAEVDQYDLCKVYGIGESEFIKLMEAKEPEIISACSPIPGARVNIDKLLVQGWEIHILTARHPKYRPITEKWLSKYHIPYHKLHLLNSHHKLEACHSLGISLMVEDNINNAYALAEGGVETIVFDAPHNLCWPWEGFRCKTWPQILETISRLKLENSN